ncbi:MAG: protein kinase [Candidatus Sumerlaeia bacterium]|nr:protein kinase [Candidatus Sumerlaeia bacterium]
MAITDRVRGLFGRRGQPDWNDPAARREAVEAAFEESCRLAAAGRPPEELREPLLELAREFQAAAQEPAEVFRFAMRAAPSDPFWKEALQAALLEQPILAKDDIPLVLEAAEERASDLALWKRVFRDCANSNDSSLLGGAYERALLQWRQFFPGATESRWPNSATETEAKRLFKIALDATRNRIKATNRTDAPAKTIIDLAAAHDLDDPQTLRRLAAEARDRGDQSPRAVELCLKALLANPDDLELKFWVSALLRGQEGCEEEGLAMLRQLATADPPHPEAQRQLVNEWKEAGRLAPADVAILDAYCASHSGDQVAAELLADFYAEREDTGEAAMRAYRAAAPKGINRQKYLRLLSKAQSTKGNWTTSIEVFQELRAEGKDSEEVVLPLAAAYAEFGRMDAEAVEAYRRAIELGSLKREVHELFVRHLYMRERSTPNSIEHFQASLRRFPDLAWARLGLIDHFLQSGDLARALDEAAVVLAKNPNDVEAVKFAAHALAANFSRRQMRVVSELSPKAARAVLEKAYQINNDALPIIEALVRSRLALEVRDDETARLLGEACRRNPELVDLRLARADMLHDLDQKVNATALYRELLERARVSGANAPFKPDELERVKRRLVSQLVATRTARASDVDLILEVSARPDAPAEWLVAAGLLLVQHHPSHPMYLATIERAAGLAPEDQELQIALAEARARRGQARPALKFALQRLALGMDDERTVELLRLIEGIITPEQAGEQSVAQLIKALLAPERTYETRAALAEVLCKAVETSEAQIEFFESVIAKLPENHRVAHKLGMCYEAAGRDAKASELYTAASSTDIMTDALAIRMARVNARLGKTDPESLKLAEYALDAAPDDADIALNVLAGRIEHNRIQDFLQLAGRLLDSRDENLADRVMGLLETSLLVTTANPKLLLLLVRCYTRAKRIDAALDGLARLQPHFSKYLTLLMDAYAEIIAAAPESLRARMERAVLFRLVGQLPEAVEDLEAAVKLAPDNYSILSDYAEVLGAKLAEEKSKDSRSWCALGEILLRIGETDEALDACVAAVELEPDNERSLLLLAQVQLESGAPELARATLARVPRSPRVFTLLQRLARSYEDREDHAAAAEVLSEALEVSGGQRDVIERLRELNQRRVQAVEEVKARESIVSRLSSPARARYDIREEIGRGTMGLVFKVYDRELDEVVVLKILPDHIAENPDMVARFRLEAKAARKLAHPNIVRIHDIGEEDGRKHLSMEYVSGGDLRGYLRARHGALPVPEAVSVLRDIARALAHAHHEGVLHRDIKPGNILVTRSGRTKLSDFGIAALMEGGPGADPRTSSDGSDTAAGTPLYMSPEQFREEPLTPASDLYSLGVVFYEMLAGRAPFTRGSVSYHHQFTAPTPLEGLPPGLWEVAERLLAKDPVERFQNAEAVLAAIAEFPAANLPPLESEDAVLGVHDEPTPVPGRPLKG